MVPIISIVGKSDTGKTTVIEKLLDELKSRGYRVATVKHNTCGFELDKPGKDTWRHAQAGAKAVVISGPGQMALMKRVEKELTLDEIASLIGEVDLILTEGYKRADKPKVEVCRKAVSRELLCRPDELTAVVTDTDSELDVPQFNFDDASGLADLLEERFIK